MRGRRKRAQLHRLAEIQRWNRLGAGSCDLRVKVRNTARPGIASASVCPAPDKTAGAFGSDPNRGYETMPAVLVMAVLSGLERDEFTFGHILRLRSSLRTRRM